MKRFKHPFFGIVVALVFISLQVWLLKTQDVEYGTKFRLTKRAIAKFPDFQIRFDDYVFSEEEEGLEGIIHQIHTMTLMEDGKPNVELKWEPTSGKGIVFKANQKLFAAELKTVSPFYVSGFFVKLLIYPYEDKDFALRHPEFYLKNISYYNSLLRADDSGVGVLSIAKSPDAVNEGPKLIAYKDTKYRPFNSLGEDIEGFSHLGEELPAGETIIVPKGNYLLCCYKGNQSQRTFEVK
ncbi:MAG: hypothetical protein V4598_05480 [Bdellovibrionota bacterium]